MPTKKKYTTSFITTPELSRAVKSYARERKLSMGAAIRELLEMRLLQVQMMHDHITGITLKQTNATIKKVLYPKRKKRKCS